MSYLQRGGDIINGFIKLFRELLKHWVYEDPIALKIWINILLTASYDNKKRLCKGTMITLEPGQLIYGRPQWSEYLKIPERKLRTVIDLLIQDGMISLHTVGKRYSIMTVKNWSDYQSIEDFLDIESFMPENAANETTNETTNDKTSENRGLEGIDVQQNDQSNVQQTSNRRPNNKNIKNNKNIYTTEFEKFYSLYPNPEDKRRTFNNWNTCLKTYSVEQLISAAKNYKNKKNGTDIKYLKTSANFLGKEKPFEDYITKVEPNKVESPEKANNVNIEVPEYFLKANGYK